MNTITNKTFSFVLAVVVALGFSFTTFSAAQAADNSALEALLLGLGLTQSQVDAVLASIDGGSGSGSSSSSTSMEYVHAGVTQDFTQYIYFGSHGDEVRRLQTALNAGGFNAGTVDGAYGPMTKAAVMAFQQANGLAVDGKVGPMTRAELNRKHAVNNDNSGSGNDSGNSTVTGDKLVISGMASDDMIVGNSQKVIFTKLTVRAGDKKVKIKDVIVKRDGTAANAAISKVMLLDSSKIELDSDSSANSDDEYKLDADVYVNAGDEATFYIAAETATNVSGSNGLDVTLKVTEVTTDGADVEGLPVMGASHELNSNASGADQYDASISDENPSDVRLGLDGVEFAKVTVNNPSAGTDDLTLRSLKIKENGTIDEEDDLDNVKLTYNGNDYDGEYVDHEFVFDFGDDGMKIEDGDDVEFMLKADITGGAGKTIAFQITDVVVEDPNGLLSSDVDTTDYGPTSATVDSYGINIAATTDVTTGNVAAGNTGVDLASFEADAQGGEDMTGKLNVEFTATWTGPDADKVSLSNVGIYTKSGDLVSSTEDVDFTTSGAPVVVEFSDVMFKSETDPVDYVVKADIDGDAYNGTTYAVKLGDGTKTYFDIDVDSGESIADVTGAAISLSAVKTVKGAALKLAVLSTLNDDTLKPDVQMAELAVVQLDAVASGKDIDVKKVSLDFSGLTEVAGNNGTYGAFALSEIDNCKLYDGSNAVSNSVDVNSNTEVFNLSGVTVTAGTIKALSLKCDLSDKFRAGTNTSVTTDDDSIQVKLDSTIANHEAKDGSEDVTPTLGTNTGDVVYAALANIVASADAEPEMVAVKAGTTVELGTVKLDATDVDGTIIELPLVVSGAAQLNPQRKVEVYADGTKVADAYFSSNNIVVDNWTAPLTVSDSHVTKLTFKALLADSPFSEGAALAVNVGPGGTNIKMANGDTYAVSAATTLSGVKVYSGLAKVEKDSVTAQPGSNKVVAKFKITADGEDIGVSSLTATSPASSTGASAGTLTVHEGTSYTDAEGNPAQAALTINSGETRYFVVTGSAVTIDTGEFINIDVDLAAKLMVNTVAINPVEGDDVETNQHISYDLTK